MAENSLDFHEIEQTSDHGDEQQPVNEEFKEPEAPSKPVIKKPATAFSLYIQDIKDSLKQELAGGKSTMFLSEAGKRWTALST